MRRSRSSSANNIGNVNPEPVIQKTINASRTSKTAPVGNNFPNVVTPVRKNNPIKSNNNVYGQLFYGLRDELIAANKYYSLINEYKSVEDNSLQQVFIKLTQQRLDAFDLIKKEIDIICPNMACEQLDGLKNIYDDLIKQYGGLCKKMARVG